MKKFNEAPKMEIEIFDTNDSITVSGDGVTSYNEVEDVSSISEDEYAVKKIQWTY